MKLRFKFHVLYLRNKMKLLMQEYKIHTLLQPESCGSLVMKLFVYSCISETISKVLQKFENRYRFSHLKHEFDDKKLRPYKGSRVTFLSQLIL